MLLYRIIRSFLRPPIIFAAILFGASTVTAVSPIQIFGIRPLAEGIGYFEYSIAPGESVQDALFVSNRSDAPLSLVVWAAQGKTMAAGGITFGEEITGPVQWVTLPEAGPIDMLPQTTQTMAFTVAVPLDTPPGEYVVGFLAARAELPEDPPPPSDDSDGSGGDIEVIVVSRVAVAMIITVPIANNCVAAITSLSSASRNGRWQLGIGMENSGNQHFRSSGQFSSWLLGDSEPITPTLFSVGYFIPGDTITYPLSIDPYPAPGLYNVQIKLLADCGIETTYTQTVSVDLYAISVSASPVEGGVGEGSGSYYGGTSVTVSATAGSGYSFVNWTESDVVVSVGSNYPFTATANRALVANFRLGVEPEAKIELVKTVGILADSCASTSTITVLPAEKVYYCYAITNRGNITLSTHSLVDDKLGPIFTDTVIDLAPGQTISTTQLGHTVDAEIITPTTNVAIWNARSDEHDLVAATVATATVYLGEGRLTMLVLDEFFAEASHTETTGGQMRYTVTVRNSGTASLKNFLLTFVVPAGTRFLSEAAPLSGSALADFLTWDCPNNAPGGTVCTLRRALLSPGDEVSVYTRLQILDEANGEPISVQFVASIDGTRLVAVPATTSTVRTPQGAGESFALHLPIISFLPPVANADAALPAR